MVASVNDGAVDTTSQAYAEAGPRQRIFFGSVQRPQVEKELPRCRDRCGTRRYLLFQEVSHDADGAAPAYERHADEDGEPIRAPQHYPDG
jgi:hypothetical protein